LGAPRRAGDEGRQASAQGVRIFGGREETRDAILDGFRNAPHTRRHHGEARAHGFENGIGEGFEAGAEHERLGGRQARRDFGLETEEAHARGEPQRACRGADGGLQGAIADQVQRPIHLRQARQRPQERGVILGRGHAGHHDQARGLLRRTRQQMRRDIAEPVVNHRHLFARCDAMFQSQPLLEFTDVDDAGGSQRGGLFEHRKDPALTPRNPIGDGPTVGCENGGNAKHGGRRTAQHPGFGSVGEHQVRPQFAERCHKAAERSGIPDRVNGNRQTGHGPEIHAGEAQLFREYAPTSGQHGHLVASCHETRAQVSYMHLGAAQVIRARIDKRQAHKRNAPRRV